MTLEWGSIPLLPLRCVLEHLSTEDAMAAMSTCTHWRNAVLLYEGHKKTIKLRAKQLEKSLFVTRLFKKHVRNLHIYIDCTEEELNSFMNYVLPHYFDAVALHEVIFIGPIYMKQSQNLKIKLKRVITESLVFKHLHYIKKLGLLGCEMDSIKNDNDRYAHKIVEYYSRPLSFNTVTSPADTIISSCNISAMMFSSLQHIIAEYDEMSTQALQTLGYLQSFNLLTLNINSSTSLEIIRWRVLNSAPSVAINIIEVPERMLSDIMGNVLVRDLNLVSLKVMFCKTLQASLIRLIVHHYRSSLREFVWVDCPYDSNDPGQRIIQSEIDSTQFFSVNPFILLCWQCEKLRRLVIHGYWIWQYELEGMVRMRRLSEMSVSGLYRAQTRFADTAPSVVRLYRSDPPPTLPSHYFIQQINEYTEYDWQPVPWSKLHPALRSGSSPQHRTEYVVNEAIHPLGVT